MLENVVMPGLIAGGSVTALQDRAVEVLGLLGLDGLEGKKANELSGGQKQRVAIARALLNRPALVLADEPTGNLDTVNAAAVYELFRTIHRELGTAFLIVTHDRGVAQRTDRILEVADGRLMQDVRDVYAAPAGASPGSTDEVARTARRPAGGGEEAGSPVEAPAGSPGETSDASEDAAGPPSGASAQTAGEAEASGPAPV